MSASDPNKLCADLPCPHCGKRQSDVVDTRGTRYHGIRRRRKCHFCEQRFTTYERIDGDPQRLTNRVIRSILKRAADALTAPKAQ